MSAESGAETDLDELEHTISDKERQQDLQWRRISTILDPKVMLSAMRFYPKRGMKTYMVRVLVRRHIEELEKAASDGDRAQLQQLLLIKAD